MAMVAMLGLVLTIGVLTTIYPQHASAFGHGFGGGNGVNGGGPPGLVIACGHAPQNPNCGGTSPTGQQHVFSGMTVP